MRSAFGWDLPPGVSQRMIDEAAGGDGPCECCGEAEDNCMCPECRCGEVGNPKCYQEHGMIYEARQLIGQARLKIASLKQQIADEEQAIAWLEEQEQGEPDEEHEPNESGFSIHPVRRPMVPSVKGRGR